MGTIFGVNCRPGNDTEADICDIWMRSANLFDRIQEILPI
jgi:hypothetical protein